MNEILKRLKEETAKSGAIEDIKKEELEKIGEAVFNKLKNDELLKRTEKPRITKEEIIGEKDTRKRLKLIQENMDLFK